LSKSDGHANNAQQSTRAQGPHLYPLTAVRRPRGWRAPPTIKSRTAC